MLQEPLMAVDPNMFKAALGRFPAGVTVITARDGDQDHGMTASAFCSLSLDPPLVLVCVKKTGHTHDLLRSATGFGVNLLNSDQISVSNRFAGWWDEGKSKWDDLTISRGDVSGAALIGGAMAWLDCTKHDELDGGDHTIFVGRVESAEVHGEDAELEPLVYFKGYRGVTDTLA